MYLGFHDFGGTKRHPGTRGSELHPQQLPQFEALWNKIDPFIHKRAGAALLALTALGALMLIATPRERGAGLILAGTYIYLSGITGFEFWQGSRVCHPAQMAWAILVAVVIDRCLNLAARRRFSRPQPLVASC